MTHKILIGFLRLYSSNTYLQKSPTNFWTG